MARLKEVSRAPEDYLRRALQASSPEHRARIAQEGLEAAGDRTDLASDTQLLLLRQIYLAHLDAGRFREAVAIAEDMTRLRTLADLAHHDASRARAALGDVDGAIAEQRLALRASPAARRSFHAWALGTLLHFAGDHTGAAAAMHRGERWAHADRPLLRAHRAWVRLEAGEAVRGLAAIVRELEASKAREGYGQLVLGMLHYHLGDRGRAAVHLRAFLRRNAAADRAKAVALREELRRARSVLAEIESD